MGCATVQGALGPTSQLVVLHGSKAEAWHVLIGTRTCALAKGT